MSRAFLSIVLSMSLVLGPEGWGVVEAMAQASAPKALTPDQQAMDKLLAPVALYPDALLAQVLACSASPQQVTEVNQWLKQNSQLQGTALQEAVEKAGFDASFIALVLFPDVLALLGQNLEWTTELGKAFTSDQAAVLESTQRLRAQAQAVGNLKTTPEQEVKSETQNGQTVIVVQPANPQVVYVPQYNPQTVYTTPPPAPAPSAAPAQDNSDKVIAAALIAFTAGIVLGAAMNNNSYGYYGYGAWGMHWHSSVVVVHGGAWRVPPGRYPYSRPVSGYHPNYNVNAPRYNNVNINVNNNNINNVNRQNVNTAGTTRTPRPTTASTTARPTTASTTARPATASTNAARPATRAGSTAPRSQTAGTASRGSAQTAARSPSTAATASPAGQMQRGSSTGAFSGYQKGSSAKAASTRGRSSAGSRPSPNRRN
jgi:hypothetical protein